MSVKKRQSPPPRPIALRLADRVPDALRELLAGWEAASSREGGEALEGLHEALSTVLLRLVFLLHAEARGIIELPEHSSPRRLLSTLRKASPEALERGTSAYRGLVLGFDHVRRRYEEPDSPHLFGGTARILEDVEIRDGVVLRLLTKLACVLDDGEMADFTAIDIEHLGTIYEATMGFVVERVRDTSLFLSIQRAGALPFDRLLAIDDTLALAGPMRMAHLEGLGLVLGAKAKRALEAASNREELIRALKPACEVSGPLPRGAYVLLRTESRRRAGSHYTSDAIAERAVRAAIEPLLRPLGPDVDPSQILAWKLCDPAMGSGAFLLAACRILADELALSWERHGMPPIPEGHDDISYARELVARSCLHGVDKDPVAVELARLSLWLTARATSQPFAFLDHTLLWADALRSPERTLFGPGEESPKGMDWEQRFAPVFMRKDASGFDVIVGNPPWVSYAGRAAQPLEAATKARYAAEYEAFAGFRNLQGLFVEKAAKLLRPGGRLGLVIPSSMSEQAGYAPTRLAHDKWCLVDDELPDLGEDSFDGVVQPCMILLSTRRTEAALLTEAAPWPVERLDLDDLARAILAKMNGESLPSSLFGERGFQTMGSEVREMTSTEDERHTLPLRVGSDIGPCRRKPPSLYADPKQLGTRIRPRETFEGVRILIRQTARVPMAALSDGLPFRNSILAGFEDEEYPAGFLVAYLNSSPIRYFHYMRHRDARQGLPQVKIGHLRSIPKPPNTCLVDLLQTMGDELSRKNAGIDEVMQREIDDHVAAAFDLSRDERERIRQFAMALS